MQIGILKERAEFESRVAASPATVKKYIDKGASVVVENGAGAGAGFTDADYEQAGASIAPSALDSDVVLCVKSPSGGSIKQLDFIGLAYISASLGRILLLLYPTFAVLFGVFFLGDRPSTKLWTGLIISYIGTLVVMAGALGQGDHKALLFGSALVILSAVCYAAYLVLAEPLINRLGQWRATGSVLTLSCAISLLHGYWVNQPIKGSLVPQMADLSITQLAANLLSNSLLGYGLVLGVFATVIPVCLVIYGIKHIGVAQSAMTSAGGPVITLLMAAVLLGESHTVIQWIGAAANISGVLLVSLSARRKSRTPSLDAAKP